MIPSAVRQVAASCLIVALASVVPAAADDVTVMTSGTFTAAYLELGPRFERATGHRLVTATTSLGVGQESIPSRLQRRETADVVIMDDAALEQLIASGLIIKGSRVPLARSGIGLAVRAGATKPDISSPDALRKALLQAASVAYSASVSGRYVSTELFQRLGIAGQMATKSRQIDRERVGAVVARGEAELGFQQTSELLPVKGIDYVGPLPAELQRVSVFSAGVAAHARQADAARALIQFLASPESAATLRKTGLDPIAPAARERTRVSISFSPRSELLGFTLAADEYRRIWDAEGRRIIDTMELMTGLRFPERHLDAEIQGGQSVAGVRYDRQGRPVSGKDPMQLRAGYRADQKKGSLVHELAHWMNAQLTVRPPDLDEHRLLFLYLYDLYAELYGKNFADREVAAGKTLKGEYDYESAWNWALSMSAATRAAKWTEVLAMNGRAAAQAAAPPAGEQVYARYCASCHDQTGPRIPSRDALAKLSPARILRILDFGPMMSVAYPLKRPEREAVAGFLGKGADEPALPASAMCLPGRRIMAGDAGISWTGWSPGSDNGRFQPRAGAGLTGADLSRLELKWAFGFPGDVTAFAAPTVLAGTLFVGSAAGAVQALDARTGCVHWQFQADGPVRAAMTIAGSGAERALVFSDQIGWVYSVDARTGRANWKIRVEAHEATRLTGSFAVHDGMAFVPAASWEETRLIDPAYVCCTFRGSVTAVRLRDGSIAWKTYLVEEPKKTGTTAVGTDTFGPSGAGVWSAPTIDAGRGVLYVTTGDNYSHPGTATSDAVMALDLKTGRVVWTRQTTPGDVYNSACGGGGPNCPAATGPDHDFGSSAVLVKTAGGRDVLVAGQKSGVVYGLDPAKRGEVVWQTRVGAGGVNGGVQWGMASDGRQVYAAVSDVGRQPGGIGGAATLGNAPLHPTQGGGLTALDVLDGRKVWTAPGLPCAPPRPGCSPAQPAAVTVIDGAVLSGAMDGHLRAFSTTDGRLLWDVDTAKRYETINGVQGMGGSLDGAGAVVAGGMVFVNSGYPRFGGMPGNAISLAFALPGPKP